MGEIVQAGAFGSQAKPVTSPGAALSRPLPRRCRAWERGADRFGEGVRRTDRAMDLMARSLPAGLGASRTGQRSAAPRRASGACLTRRDRQARIHLRQGSA